MVQVTQVNDTITHAVIGKSKAQDFGISSSAEFFHILSNTLYSDKILAAIREPLCNAWDIHIQTGRTDKPIEVTLDRANLKLTIRDFGTGISDEDIHPIYAVYGNSTKKLDGTQTGGFGLGSKSPFAVVDHFEVTSWFNTKKTIYAVSKSSAEVGGKPSIMPLVTIPCGEETGLAVSFSIKHEDIPRIDRVIRMIARFGEMNVLYNGEALETVPFSQAKHGFLMTQDMTEVPGGDNHYIYVRYGNVVYPIAQHQEYKKLYDEVSQLINKISSTGRGWRSSHTPWWRVIFQAEPNTISVTPSRESLSMTDHTIAAVKILLQNFLDLTTGKLATDCVNIERQAIAAMWSSKDHRPADLLTSDNKLPFFTPKGEYYEKAVVESNPLKFLVDTPTIARAYMVNNYPDFPGFRKQDVDMRLQALEKNGFGGPKNRGKIQSFRRQYAVADRGEYCSTWFQRVLVAPLVKRLNEVPELDGKKLLVYGTHQDESVDVNGRRRFGYGLRECFTPATDLSKRTMEEYLPFLRNMIVLSFNRADVEERLPKFPIMKEQLGKSLDFFVYIVSRTDKKIDIVRKFFADQGMTVVDLTKRQDWEPEEVTRPVPKAKPSAPRKKGLPLLSSLMSLKPNRYDSNLLEPCIAHERLLTTNKNFETLERIEQPQFIVKINPRAQELNMIYGMDRSMQTAVAQLYGHLAGVVVNENQHARFRDQLKIPAAREWLGAKIKEEVTTNPRIQLALQVWRALQDRTLHEDKYTSAINTMFRCPDFAIELGILNEMTKLDLLLVDMIASFRQSYSSWSDKPDRIVVNEHIQNIKIAPEVGSFLDKLAKSKLVGLLKMNQFSEILGDTPTQHQKKQKSGALDLLLYAIEG